MATWCILILAVTLMVTVAKAETFTCQYDEYSSDCMFSDIKLLTDDILDAAVFLHNEERNATEVIFSESWMTTVKRHMFKHFPQITGLKITANVQSVENDAFADLTMLTSLILRKNRLPQVPTDALSKLPNLTKLVLSNNEFHEIIEFPNLKNLKELHLSHNFISSIKPEAFHTLPSLSVLSLRTNLLDKLHDDTFGKQDALSHLDMSNNNLVKLRANLFRPLKSLSILNLENNLLTTLAPNVFEHLKSLQQLKVSLNYVKQLSAGVLVGCPKLYFLEMHNNLIDSIHPDFFNVTKELTFIHMFDNKLTNLPSELFKGLNKLKYLVLEGNQMRNFTLHTTANVNIHFKDNDLQAVKADMFADAQNVKLVDLSHNKIETIEENAFFGLSSVTEIVLEHNKITGLPADFLKDAVQLQVFNCAFNLLEAIQSRAFASLDLSSIDLSNNKITTLGENAFYNSTVRSIDLTANFLTVFAEGPFLGASVSRVSLTGNRISTFHIDGSGVFGSLDAIMFGNNSLQRIDSESLINIRQVTNFELNDNQISSFDVGVFNASKAVKVINLRGNRLTSFPTLSLGASSDYFLNVDLSYNELTVVPTTNTKLNELILDGNRIAVLDSTSFEGMKVEYLYLRNISIRSLGPDIFQSISDSLTHLEVSSSELTKVEEDTFKNSSLTVLRLTDSPIAQLPAALLHRLASLSQVSFARNRLTYLHSDFFNACTSLTEVNLSYNQLTAIDPDWFKNLAKLENLDLTGNQISQLPVNLPVVPNSYISLLLAHNRIHRIDPNSFLTNQQFNFLNLSHNLLTDVSELRHNDHIVSLDVSDNRLTTLFVHPTTESLVADRNQIATLHFAEHTRWYELLYFSLADNRLTEVSDKIFDMRKLAMLNISSNMLEQFPFNEVHRLTLFALNISYNALSGLSFENVTRFGVGVLDLSHNNIGEIPSHMITENRINNLIK